MDATNSSFTFSNDFYNEMKEKGILVECDDNNNDDTESNSDSGVVSIESLSWLFDPFDCDTSSSSDNSDNNYNNSEIGNYVSTINLFSCNKLIEVNNLTNSNVNITLPITKNSQFENMKKNDEITTYSFVENECGDDNDNNGEEEDVVRIECPYSTHEIPCSTSNISHSSSSSYFNFTCPQLNYNSKCLYWDSLNVEWSDEGCSVISMNWTEGEVLCECNHLSDYTSLEYSSIGDVYVTYGSLSHISKGDIKRNLGVVLMLGGLYLFVMIWIPFANRKVIEIKILI